MRDANGDYMNISTILGELQAERDRLDRAITAIEAINSTGRRRVGGPPRAAATERTRGRMSAAARRKLSRLLKQRWAQGKMKPRAKAKRAEAPKSRTMSQSARRKIAAAQRARWAKQKPQQRKAA